MSIDDVPILDLQMAKQTQQVAHSINKTCVQTRRLTST